MMHSIFVDVGKRVRERRWVVGMTAQQLGDEIGITAQQIQNYEAGASRIGYSVMWSITAAMDVPVSFFFEGLALALGDAA